MNRRIYTGAALTLISIALVPMAPASAADPTNPIRNLVTKVSTALAPPSAPSTSVEAPPPTDDSDSPGNETVDPVAPDHGSAAGIVAKLGDSDVAGQGSNDATINDDDSTKADSVLLSLGGNEVLGTHADSTGTTQSSFDPLDPLTGAVCDGTSGGACLEVLYAEAEATDDGTTSHSHSRSGILSACIGGSSAVPGAPCTGVVGTGVSNSEGTADRDQASGQTTASSSYETADLCVAKNAVTGICPVGADALESQGEADSGATQSSPGTASRSSRVAAVALGGQVIEPISTEPTDLSIQPACADPSLLCVFLNQGETYLADGIAGTAQDALKATVLPGALDLFAGVGHTETLVHNDGGETEPPTEPPVDNPPPKDGPDGPDDDSVLPDTGGPMAGLLILSMLGIAGGSFAVAAGRRERITLG